MPEDLALFHKRGAVSAYKRFSIWEQEVRKRLPSFQGQIMRREIQAGSCIFDGAKTCRHCFQCIGLINQKNRLKSGQKLKQAIGRDFLSPEDMKDHMEEIKIHLRGHNLFDIFYGRYKKEEQALLKQYIDLAPRDDFEDILEAIDQFVYFDSRRHIE